MSPEALAELNPVKMIVGVVAMLGIMGLGFLLSSLSGPSTADLEEMRIRDMQMRASFAQQQMLDEMRYEMLPQGYDVGAALQYGD